MTRFLFFLFLFCCSSPLLFSQTKKQVYPEPEFNNEIYLFQKDSSKLMRLEKGSSKMQSKSKLGGMGGMENGYSLEENKSPVRIPGGTQLSFIFYKGSSSSTTTAETDSILKANGMDPSMSNQANGTMDMLTDPSKSTSLYNVNVEKNSRKITLQSYQGMKLLGKSKKESIKYTLSVKKIKDGYYELVVDKQLPKGEYAFVMTDYGSMDGSFLLFAFGID